MIFPLESRGRRLRENKTNRVACWWWVMLPDENTHRAARPFGDCVVVPQRWDTADTEREILDFIYIIRIFSFFERNIRHVSHLFDLFMNTRQNPSIRATQKFIRLRETSLLLHDTCSIHTKVTRFASLLLLLPFCFLSIFPANERTMRRRWFRLSRKECGKVKKEQEVEEEDDTRNEKKALTQK